MRIAADTSQPACRLALDLFQSGINAVLPDRLIGRTCSRSGSQLSIGSLQIDLDDFARVWIAGAGKASWGLANALEPLVAGELHGGLVVTKHAHAIGNGKISVMEASHPVPDQSSLLAGEAMIRFAGQLGKADLVLFLLSGGASALLELPQPGITLGFLEAENRRLLSEMVAIQDINRQRSSWSRIKGGRLGEAFQPATVVCLVLSDVLGDDLATIGSGPLYSPTSRIPHILLGNLFTALDAVTSRAAELQLPTRSEREWIFAGEARVQATEWCQQFLDTPGSPTVWVGGGEPLVRVQGTGEGGRCQEFACAGAQVLAGHENLALLAAATDGADGPTPNAGGLVHGHSRFVAARAGVDSEHALQENDSGRFLSACGGLIQTGPTQTNVNDLFILVRV